MKIFVNYEATPSVATHSEPVSDRWVVARLAKDKLPNFTPPVAGSTL